LQKPPPWAYPLWTTQEVYRNSNDRMSRSTAQAIDQAMTHVSEPKFVSLNLSVETRYNGQPGKTYREGVHEASGAEHDSDLEWVRVVLTADPGVRLEDIEDKAPPRKKEHRRVPSTVAIEEVKVSLSVLFYF